MYIWFWPTLGACVRAPRSDWSLLVEDRYTWVLRKRERDREAGYRVYVYT